MITTSVISASDDIKLLVDEINQALWDAANDMSRYDVEALLSYLERQDTVFVACHEVVNAGRTLLGIASSRLELKPYDSERWLYVDEVDVCVNQRRKGAGKALMRKLIEIAQGAGCTEVWLGTEVDNRAANALYRSLDPAEVGPFVGYTFEP